MVKVELRDGDPVREKVDAYVKKRIKSLEGKNLIIKDCGAHFEVLKMKDASPMFFDKSILG